MNERTSEPTSSGPSTQHWKFFRAGDFDQVRLDTGADLLALPGLDPKLWVALSAPTANIEFPAATLSCLDTDHDGHIRIPELLAAIDWCAARLGKVDLLIGGPPALPLAAIDQNSAAGQKVLASARRILGNLGTPDADAIAADALADPTRIFGQTAFNGDGVITALSSDDPTLQAAINAIGEVFGRRLDRSGENGVDGDAIGAFFALAGQQIDWFEKRPAGLGDSAEQASVMAELTARIGAKIDDYFNRCRLSAYDPRAVSFVNSSDAELDAIGRGPLAVPPPTLAALPLARIEPGRPLPLGEGLNPAWAAELLAWREQVLSPLLGATPGQLDQAGWELVKARATPLLDWYAARPAWPVGMPEVATLRTWLANDVESRLRRLLDADLALADEAAGVDEVRQLVLYVRDLARFA
ncbi:MAG TPA: hypothetical protein VFH22_03680, partial [Rhodocyclaceae bacterium]|nr:hypothetical protein [Rhodocyclaceae bacterium]